MKKIAILFLFYNVFFYYAPQTIAYSLTDWMLSVVAEIMPKTASTSHEMISVLNTEDKKNVIAEEKIKNILIESGKESINLGTFLMKIGSGIMATTAIVTTAWDSISPACCTYYSSRSQAQGYSPAYPVRLAGYTAGTSLIGVGLTLNAMGRYQTKIDSDTNNLKKTPDSNNGTEKKSM